MGVFEDGSDPNGILLAAGFALVDALCFTAGDSATSRGGNLTDGARDGRMAAGIPLESGFPAAC